MRDSVGGIGYGAGVTMREITMRGGPHDGETLMVDGHRIDMADESWKPEDGALPVHTYTVQRDETGTFYGRYDGAYRA